MARGEIGLRRGVGHSGEYAFKKQSQGTIESDLIEVDRENTYELKGFFKADSNAVSGVLFGMLLYDAQKRPIMCWNVSSIKGTMTELTAALVTGDKTLKVKDASAWKPSQNFVAAFGKKENELNFDITPSGIVEIKQEGDHWRVVLDKPCDLAFPAGTPVVENTAGGNGLFFAGAITNGNWTEIKGTIGPKQWWLGTKYVTVYIQPKRTGNAGGLLMDDLSLKLKTDSAE